MASSEAPQGKNRDILTLASDVVWESWLAEHHAASTGIWLKIVKKGSSKNGPSYAGALEVALCFGWIDGQKDRLDSDFWLQRFTPRAPRSKWSKVNRETASALIKADRMRPPGLVQIQQAKADGRWDAAYDSQGSATVPADLERALDTNAKARNFFSTLDSRNRYSIIYRIHHAASPTARAQRIEKYVAMLSVEKKIHP